jgi:hypothetical protein
VRCGQCGASLGRQTGSAERAAGVGKSRLGWEFWKYVDGLAEEIWWHRGHCLSYGEGVAFWALAEIVRQRLGIAEEDAAEVAAAKLRDGVDRFVPDPAERAYVGVRLSRLLGVPFPGDAGGPLTREELFGGWRLFFERMAAESPVALVVEDAQYADAGLLDFLDHLIDWARDLPVYVLVLARTEVHQARPGFGAGRNRSTLTLDPLDRASMGRLVEALVPGMPPVARAKIIDQAQGLPLFAVETVRALIDRDVVQPFEGVYRLVGDLGDLAVPDSLHALLAGRRPEATAYLREGARLATQARDTLTLGRTLSNLSHVLGCVARLRRGADPPGRRRSRDPSRRRGHRDRRPAPLPAAARPGRGADGRPGADHGSSRCTSPNSCHRYPDVTAAS